MERKGGAGRHITYLPVGDTQSLAGGDVWWSAGPSRLHYWADLQCVMPASPGPVQRVESPTLYPKRPEILHSTSITGTQTDTQKIAGILVPYLISIFECSLTY